MFRQQTVVLKPAAELNLHKDEEIIIWSERGFLQNTIGGEVIAFFATILARYLELKNEAFKVMHWLGDDYIALIYISAVQAAPEHIQNV